MQGDYNLSSIVSADIINEPTKWLFNFNSELGGWFLIISLAVIGLILFLTMRKADNIKDTEAASYSGFIISIAGLLLVLIKVDGNSLLTFTQVFPIWVITGISVMVDRFKGRY